MKKEGRENIIFEFFFFRRAKKGKCALHMAGKIDNGRIELGIIGNLIELE